MGRFEGMDSKEKGYAAVWGAMVGGSLVVFWVKDFAGLALGLSLVAVIFGLGSLLEVIGFDPRPEKGAARQADRAAQVQATDSPPSPLPPRG